MTYAQFFIVVALAALVGRLIDLLYTARHKRLDEQHYRDVVLPNLRDHEARQDDNRSARWHG